MKSYVKGENLSENLIWIKKEKEKNLMQILFNSNKKCYLKDSNGGKWKKNIS